MKRSKWKGPFLSQHEVKKKLLILSRNIEVTSNLAGQTVHVSNGKGFAPVSIADEMIGHKLGWM